MNNLLRLALVAGPLFLMTGCGVILPSRNDLNLTQTQVELSQNNFEVKGQAYGEAKAIYICGIGGLKTKTLRANAIHEMSRNARLTGAQTLTNVTTHQSIRMITPLYVEVTIRAYANIIEFR